MERLGHYYFMIFGYIAGIVWPGWGHFVGIIIGFLIYDGIKALMRKRANDVRP